ncbi:MAG TPA: VWA domain-containing protein [Thermoanaerobaculia bacterium]|jgi:VWFA-related protein|nr:VWA domain-containing protein [Thermoanaerobaculia bacterium]
MKGLEKAWRFGAGFALAGLVLALPEISSRQGWAQTAPSPPPATEGAPPPTDAPPFVSTTQVLSVEVPVQVVRDGEPVRGLTAADFEVWEGRRRLAVTGFEALDLAAAKGARTPVPAAARRHFLLLFDLAFSEPKAIARARAAAARLITQLQPSDLAAVATYSATRGPQLVLGFTPDRRQLDNALNSLGLPDLITRPMDPLRLVLEEVLSAGNAVGGSAPVPGRDPLAEATDAAVLSRMEAVTNAVEGADRTALRNHVNNFTRSLADLARQITVVEGRKYVVFLSEGFDTALFQGTGDTARQEEMRENSLHGESWRNNPEERYGLTEVSNDIERMLEEFRRADCVIQAVDIGGLRAGAEQGAPRPVGRDSLLMMAKGTGGELYESFNDLTVAFTQMLQRTSVTYVLAVEPDRLQPEGEYHRLRVELKKPLRGARLVHRPGYFLPKTYQEETSLEKLLETANLVMSGEESDAVATAVLATPFRGAGEKAYVPVLIEVDGATLLAGQQPPKLGVEVYLYALDATGAVHDFLTQTIGLDLAKAGTGLRSSGLKFFGHLDLLPGDYSLRILVRNAASGRSGLRVVPVHVPAFGSEPWLLPALFPDPPDRWIITREEPRGESKEAAPYPFLLGGGQSFVPASKPALYPGREVRLMLFGSNLGGADWKAEARVLTPDGHELPGGALEIKERLAGTATTPDRAIAHFKPPDLKPGEYVLRVTVASAGGAAGGTPSVASSIRFVVPPPAPPHGARN